MASRERERQGESPTHCSRSFASFIPLYTSLSDNIHNERTLGRGATIKQVKYGAAEGSLLKAWLEEESEVERERAKGRGRAAKRVV